MAPTAEAAYAYFPSLGDCFTGDAQLASWDTIHLELLGVDAATSSEDRASTAFLLRLLEQPEPQAILRHALTPFAGPSASTDAAKSFESQLSTASRLTDAQKSRAGVDASEVKSDALWLSKACGLDELSALRVVALEWQQRPVSELLRRFSDEEVASLLDVVGGVGGAARPGESVYGQAHGHTRVAGLLQARRGDMQPTLSDGSDYSRKASPSAEETRRLRIWSTYLAERRGVLGVARRLMCVALRGVMPASVEGVVVENDNRREEEEEEGEEGSCRHQLAKLARVIFNTSSNSPFSARGCTDALAARLKAIEDGSNYRSTETAPSTTSNSTSSNNDKAANPAIETAWLTSHLEETLQILQLLLLVLESSSELTAPDDLLAWLRLMADRNFLEGLCPATPQQASMYPLLQAYVAAVSLAFLKLAVAQRELGQVETEIALDVPEAWLRGPGVPFFLNGDHVAEIMELLSTAATAGVHTAGPAVIAWCVIMLVVHHLGVRAKEMRQEDGELARAAEGSAAAETSPTHDRSSVSAASGFAGAVEDLSPFEIAMRRTSIHGETRDENGEEVVNGPVQLLFTTAADCCAVFDVTSRLVEVLDTTVTGPGTTASGPTALPRSDQLVSCWARAGLLRLLSCCVEVLGYSTEVVSAALVAADSPAAAGLACSPRQMLAADDNLTVQLVAAARGRFPYEAANFVKVCRVLVGAQMAGDVEYGADGLGPLAHQLAHMPTYTQLVPDGFVSYQPVREEEGLDWVQLLAPLPIVEVLPSPEDDDGAKQAAGPTAAAESAFIPAGTMGQVASATRPAVIMWHHEYNAWRFFGSCLERYAGGYMLNGTLDDETMIEVIGLLGDVLRARRNAGAAATAEARRVLEMASDDLSHTGDVVSLVLDILEQDLQALRHSGGGGGGAQAQAQALALPLACLRFVTGLLRVMPARVWPFLARSSLLGLGAGGAAGGGSSSRGGVLVHVVSAVEVVAGEFAFLAAAVELYEALVVQAADHLAGADGDDGSAHVSSVGVPPHVMQQILATMTRTMVEVFNINATWRFADPAQQAAINTVLATVFKRVIALVGDDDDLTTTTPTNPRTLAAFAPAAEHLVTVLRPAAGEGLPLNAVLGALAAELQTPPDTANGGAGTRRTQQTLAALRLAERVVQTGRRLGLRASAFEAQLAAAAPLLVRLHAARRAFRLPVARLLGLLVSRAAADEMMMAEAEEEEGRGQLLPPVSLFGALGPAATCRFLDCLAADVGMSGAATTDVRLRQRTWGLLTEIVTSRQQWIAVLILAGSSPSRRPVGGGSSTAGANLTAEAGPQPAMRSTPFLQRALDVLERHDEKTGGTTSPTTIEVMAATQFLAAAQEHWGWLTPQLFEDGRQALFGRVLADLAGVSAADVAGRDAGLGLMIDEFVREQYIIMMNINAGYNKV